MAGLMSPKELNDRGDKYFYGQGVDKNIEVAFTYYKQAADQNNPVGLTNVGKYFLAKNNDEEALKYYQLAAELKYPYAYVKLSDMYLNGIGTKKSKKKAFKMLEKATELNEIDSYHLLGKFYLLGIGTSKNEQMAFELFQKSAQNKNYEGMFLLGDLLITGNKIKTDFESAIFYLEKAAANKNINAIKYLKNLYSEPHPLLKKKSETYLKEMWFYYDVMLANLDDEEALKRVAESYYYGDDYTKINFEKSAKYFKILHSKDILEGYLGLGLSYMYGQGVASDFERARDYLTIAANRNNAKAKNALGDMYRLGKGVIVDYARARDFYLEAAKQNDEDALINLGLLHYRKQIKNASDILALQFMTKASELEAPASFYWLGIFLDKGVGTDRSTDKSVKYFEKAIQKGNVGANYKLGQLLYDETFREKYSKRKADKTYQQVKELLINYINNPLNQEVNAFYSMLILGDMYLLDSFSEKSTKVSRYWYELAAEKGFSKAMVKMYHILKNSYPERALYWLNKACKKPADGEELFEMGLVYENGLYGLTPDKVRAEGLFKKAAELKFKPAILKLTINNN